MMENLSVLPCLFCQIIDTNSALGWTGTKAGCKTGNYSWHFRHSFVHGACSVARTWKSFSTSGPWLHGCVLLPEFWL